ncbi:hypothetical protein FLONG3_10884 [Fusarium longipes]|uniref:Uncharacterized protein n=1 Tax=Fusarium longipes TaxID=694270 RepID=A0A395RJW2_9HYPO|nr:hypothetical protein FLONG3_10884 [Fusarium longipes]
MNRNSLCWDVQYEILCHFVTIVTTEEAPCAGYARVAKDWQPIFEPHIFERLCVSSPAFKLFQQSFRIKRRRAYLKHITFIPNLDIHDDPYNFVPQPTLLSRTQILQQISQSQKFNIERRQRTNPFSFVTAVRDLFEELATWAPEEASPRGIGLEIKVVEKRPQLTQNSVGG